MSLSVMTTVILCRYIVEKEAEFSNRALELGIWSSVGRIAWSLSVAYIIIACDSGYGGPINDFLSLPLFQPLARISYSTYLLHIFVLNMTMATTRTPLRYSKANMVRTFSKSDFWRYICLDNDYGWNIIV